MHQIQTVEGAIDQERELILIEQTPGEIVFLSAADTDLVCAAQSWGDTFGQRLRLAHAGPLRQPVSADDYVERVLKHARIVVAKLLGGYAYFPHLIEGLSRLKDQKNAPELIVLSGAEALDPECLPLNSVDPQTSNIFFDLMREGGIENFASAACCVEKVLSGESIKAEIKRIPDFGVYHEAAQAKQKARAWICFYKAWMQSGDLKVVDALKTQLEKQGFGVDCLYAYSLRDKEAQQWMLERARAQEDLTIILTMQSFALCGDEEEGISFLERLGVPVLQTPVGLSSQEVWEKNPLGLSPSEVAMNVVLPEVDGRVFSSVAGFKEVQEETQTPYEFKIRALQPHFGQCEFIANLAQKWARLKNISNSEKRVALVLSNYPNKDGRIGNGVGLDTPASTVHLLQELNKAGYTLDRIPESGDQLMEWLQEGATNDPELSYGMPLRETLSADAFDSAFKALPESAQQAVRDKWADHFEETYSVPGMKLGNIFIGIQPPRGFSMQTQEIYHSPDLPPPPVYLAFYFWIRKCFHADALVEVGKHGNLEWLPGRSIALGANDFPQACLGPLPFLYSFIVNNPGEGAQAKRRTSSVIVDHLTPPLTRAGLYDEMVVIERLLEEHAHAVTLYPKRAEELEIQINEKLQNSHWSKELNSKTPSLDEVSHFLCEIKESMIRSGLHVLGKSPHGEKQVDFILSLVRHPTDKSPGLYEALLEQGQRQGQAIKDWDALTAKQRDELDAAARAWVQGVLNGKAETSQNETLHHLRQWIKSQILIKLKQCENEISNLLRGLDGKFIQPGPSGPPTRGRLDVLPTGRNFYSIDPRVIPTPTAWRCGKQMAEQVLERHFQDHGEYPQTLALVIWGTSNMRTGGDDIAQALWLWGCEPVWDDVTGRVIDFKILPASILGRPRVDVVLRVSGLFRDSFGDVLKLLATVPKRLVEQDEDEALNPLITRYHEDSKLLIDRGVERDDAQRLSKLRVFSSAPGSYGTGLLPLIDGGNWQSRKDLSEVFCRWGNCAYDADGSYHEDTELFKSRLRTVQVVHQNQDNREHDILDSDDYFQFQGGLQASIESLRGSKPVTYHGDSSQPDRLKVRTIQEEFAKVMYSRVLNPKWISAMREHGYKGAFEIAATIDYAFGYDATCDLVEDHHYEQMSERLLLNEEQKQFFKNHNPAAYRESLERLMEAIDRGLWKEPDEQTQDQLRECYLEIQGDLE
ncbi:MAG: cobaltochelatase subunit CobN [Verrucomicrobiota bacterium]